MKGKIVSLAAAVVLAAPLAANAKSITYDFMVNGGGAGPLANLTSSGSFTFDSAIIPTGGGLVTGTALLTELSFTWDGLSYDPTTANTGALEFNSSGILDGVNIGNSCDAFGACGLHGDSHDWDLSGFTPGGTLASAEFLYTVGDGQLYNSFQGRVAAAPEIDPAMAASGVTLLLGGLAVLRGGRRKAES